MKNMDDYRFQNELEYQLALLESIRKLLLVYEKFYQEETKGDMLPRIGGSILSHQELTRTLQKSYSEFWNHKKEALQELSRIRECGKKSMREKGIVIAMEYVIHAFGLTDFEAFLLILAWASQMDHETGLAVSAMCEYQGEKGPTIHFCARLYALEEAETIEFQGSGSGRQSGTGVSVPQLRAGLSQAAGADPCSGHQLQRKYRERCKRVGGGPAGRSAGHGNHRQG